MLLKSPPTNKCSSSLQLSDIVKRVSKKDNLSSVTVGVYTQTSTKMGFSNSALMFNILPLKIYNICTMSWDAGIKNIVTYETDPRHCTAHNPLALPRSHSSDYWPLHLSALCISASAKLCDCDLVSFPGTLSVIKLGCLYICPLLRFVTEQAKAVSWWQLLGSTTTKQQRWKNVSCSSPLPFYWVS